MHEMIQQFYQTLDRAYADGGIAQAERFLLDYIAAAADDHARIAAYNELGSLYRGTSRFPQSMDAFEQAETLAAKACGPTSSQYATVLNNMAGTCRLVQECEKAVALFQKAIAIYAQAGEDNGYLYASVWNNLSLAYRDMGRIPDAIRCAEQALAIMDILSGYKQERAVTYQNLAALCHAAGDRENTARYLKLALDAFDSCSDEENVHFAAGLNSLASVLYSTGAYENALTAFRKSAEYTLHFFGENLDYAITYQNMSRVFETMRRVPDAINALRTARDLYAGLLGADHPRTRNADAELTQLQKEAGL